MHILISILTSAFFFVSHSIYRNLFEPYIKNLYLNIFAYIFLFVIGQSFWFLFNDKLNKYIEYPIYIIIFTFSCMFFYYIIMTPLRLFYFQNNMQTLDLKVILIVIAMGIFGFFNRYNVVTTKYKIETNKNVKLKIAFVSDVHLGDSGINEVILQKMVNKINEQNVDLIILGGDIVEKNDKIFTEKDHNEYFKQLKSKYGVYATLGNHEYYGGVPYKISETMENNGGIIMLNDKVAEFNDFILIGREDITKNYLVGPRKNIDEILIFPSDKYKIVIDHNPASFKESIDNEIDLQISGHTHNGQFFPYNIIVKFFYEKPYGLLKKKNNKLIISSGLSTWRIPIKLFSKPEIVIIEIN